jgi:zinc transport system substrate-binding protein
MNIRIPCIAAIALFLCSVCAQKHTIEDRISVVTSIVPLAEFIEQVGTDRVIVTVMVPPGASPHSYEPTPGQLVHVSKAHAYVKLGTNIEFEMAWLDRLLETNRSITVIDASTGITLISGEHEHNHANEHSNDTKHDPHIWLSPKNAEQMVSNICTGLIAIDSAYRNHYTKNRDKYISLLDSLDRYIRKILMTYHPSWSYFSREYNIEQIPVEIQGKEPTARIMQQLIARAKKDNIQVIFASPQFNTKSVEAIAHEIQGKVVLIDPLDKNYIENLGMVAEAIAGAVE